MTNKLTTVPGTPEERKRKRKEYERIYKLTHKNIISQQGKRYYRKHKDRINKRQKIYSANIGNFKKYNITLGEYNILLKKQNHVCAICGEHEKTTLRGKVKKLAIDHCHKTKAIRGLLCNMCNRGLGYFRDNTKILNSAINYLDKYKKSFDNQSDELKQFLYDMIVGFGDAWGGGVK